NYQAANGTGTLTINKATTAIALSNLTQTYDGTPKSPAAATTSPAGLSGISITYNDPSTTHTVAGTYGVVASLNNDNYAAPDVSDTLTINKAAATISLSGLVQIYDGSPKTATATTNPASLTGVSITYDGSATAPTNAGSNYAVVASLTNDNYAAPNVDGTLIINKATATISLSGLMRTYDGSPKTATATTSPANLTEISITYDGSATAPTNGGSYPVVATLNNSNYQGSATGTLTIGKATATIALGDLTFTYDGSTKQATATTTPAGLETVTMTYD